VKKTVELPSILRNRPPIRALADDDFAELAAVTPEGEEGPDDILPYLEPTGANTFDLWFAVVEKGRVSRRINSRHVSVVIHDTSDEALAAADAASKAETLEMFRAKGQDGVYSVPTDKLREIVNSQTVPDRVREAAAHELKHRTVVGLNPKGA